MKPKLMQISRFAGLILVVGGIGTAIAHGQDLEPQEILKNNDLKRSGGATWVLARETVILKDVRTAKSLSTQLNSAQQQQQALELGNQNPQVLIDNYRQQIDWLDESIRGYDQELANLGPTGGNQAGAVYHNMLVSERNALVAQQNRLSALISSLANARGEFQDQKQQFYGEVARLRESYVQAVTDLRTAVEEITAKYAEVSGKDAVTKALKTLSTSSKVKQKLGPSKELTAAIKWLARLEGSVQTETVPLFRENGVDHVDVMLNGKGPIRMVFDTGAGPTSISSELAIRLGLKPTGRSVSLVVADGSKVMAKEMVIRTVGLGRLHIKDVTCVVMPKEKGDVDPLLGQSILQRFDFKYTQGTGRLVLTKVETDEPAKTPGNRTTPKKKRQ
jgi:clan AA aspartic protease (TIGR02281 family)